ncbi:alpha/beta fold hydrolase [Halodesulfovibrio sp.]|jgi:carboxylesterase|uniref:alpha/beta hydrolase n=1 Tax=Halodesulfovibrio sp. TaxID=1912772 RepID=UPI0025E24095|nr:alpha/beta fold hydrolase [Halodesulfovibrio sp.]MCT4533930.1 alpha/beta fold hydrolase [Halodesulfovibrio sp.]MCT4628160.1 alpha/beta fold hydrolase [Halodesulfovibrio sp.]
MKVGCLLIHGWTGSSFEMEPFVEPLEADGVVVRNIMLPGHGTTFEDFQTTGWSDWEWAAEKEYAALAEQVDAVFVVGISMGGTLALHVASKFPVAGVVSLAAPLYLYSLFPWQMKDWRIPFTPIIKHLKPVFPLGRRDETHLKIAPWEGYDEFVSLQQLHELMNGVKKVRQEVNSITAPILIVQAPTDRSVPLGNVFLLAKSVSSKDVTIKLLRIEEKVTGHHIITTHVETSEKIVQLVREFIKTHFYTKM